MCMSPRTQLVRFVFLATLLLVFLPPASGWTSQNWSVTPAGAEISAGTPVTAGCSLHFESWETGLTFDEDNSLMLYTDLSSPQWTVKKIETIDDLQPPVIETIATRQTGQVKIDGWSLSYARKRFDIFVELTGNAPAWNQSGTITIVKLQEMAPGSKSVAGTVIKKEKFLLVPTLLPIVAPSEETIPMTPAEIPEVTPEPKVPLTTITPTKKVTYSPGPEPLLVGGMLAGLVLLARYAGRKQ
jgi:hypothetical protein